MSFFDSFLGVLNSPLLKTGAGILGNYTTQKANVKNTKVFNQQQQAAADARNAAQAQAQQQFVQNQQMFQQNQAMTSPGVAFQQGQVATANSGQLTAAQELALDDARRRSENALAVSGLRGSGRATTGIIKDVEGTLRANFMDQNLQRGQNAASALSQQFFNSSQQVAGESDNIARSQVQIGDNQARSLIDQSNASAKNADANTRLKAGMIGSIPDMASQVADVAPRAIDSIQSLITAQNKKSASQNFNPGRV